MATDPKWSFPWKQPISHYDTNGPSHALLFDLNGVSFYVEPTNRDGIHTARTRYLVECNTCKTVLHPSTTGTSHWIERHLKERHQQSQGEQQ